MCRCLFTIVSLECLKCESVSVGRLFQPGDGPSRGLLLHDCGNQCINCSSSINMSISAIAMYLPIVSHTRPHKSCCQASRVPEDRKVQNPGVRRRRNCGVRTSVDCSDCSVAAAAAGGCCSVWTTWARTHSAPTRPAPSSLSAQVTGTVQRLTTHFNGH